MRSPPSFGESTSFLTESDGAFKVQILTVDGVGKSWSPLVAIPGSVFIVERDDSACVPCDTPSADCGSFCGTWLKFSWRCPGRRFHVLGVSWGYSLICVGCAGCRSRVFGCFLFRQAAQRLGTHKWRFSYHSFVELGNLHKDVHSEHFSNSQLSLFTRGGGFVSCS